MLLNERRHHPRRKVRDVKTWMLVGQGRPEQCTVVDVSRKGVLVESTRFMRPGTKVELAFVNAGDSKVTKLIRRSGQVVRSSRQSFAVFFVQPQIPPNTAGQLGLRS